MAGLSCGEPSELAWAVLGTAATGFMTIPEDLVAPTVRMLAAGAYGDPRIEAGESAVAGLIGAICGATQPDMRDALQLDENACVVVIGTEGVTDPHVYGRIMAGDL